MFKQVSHKVIAAHRLSRNYSLKQRHAAATAASTTDTTSNFTNTTSNNDDDTFSERKLKSSRLAVHNIKLVISSTGRYLYEVKLSCDDQDASTCHQWNIRFTYDEFQHVFSSGGDIREKLKETNCWKIMIAMIAGKRGDVAKGSSTLRVARYDRIRRNVWKVFQTMLFLLGIVILSYVGRWCLEYFHDPTWSEARLWSVSASLVLLLGVMYWLFDAFVLQMLPTSFLHQYRQSQVHYIRDTLMKELSSPTFMLTLKNNKAMSSLLQFSAQSLRRRLPDAVKEGYLLCRIQGRSEFESERSVRIEGGCCRCSVEFGMGRSWHNRWAVLRNTGISFFRQPYDRSPTHMILFDTQFYASKCRDVLVEGRSRPCLVVAGSNTMCELGLPSKHAVEEWFRAISFATAYGSGSQGSSWTMEHQYGSFAPRRSIANVTEGVPSQQKIRSPARPPEARWLLNGRGYYALVAKEIASAKSEIFITGWFFTPEILIMRKKTSTKNEVDWSILEACVEAARRGVFVYILLYEEIPQALANNSRRAQNMMENAHSNIRVLRHRSRFSSNVYWYVPLNSMKQFFLKFLQAQRTLAYFFLFFSFFFFFFYPFFVSGLSSLPQKVAS